MNGRALALLTSLALICFTVGIVGAVWRHFDAQELVSAAEAGREACAADARRYTDFIVKGDPEFAALGLAVGACGVLVLPAGGRLWACEIQEPDGTTHVLPLTDYDCP